MKRIITIGREFGAGGGELGRRLARELNIAYYDRDIILKTAKASAHLTPEQVRRWDERIPHEFGFTQSLFNFYNRPLSEELWDAQVRAIRELADKESCVIVGRNADYILREFDHCLRVFVHADRNWRLLRMRKLMPDTPFDQLESDMDTADHTYSELATLMTRYANGLQIGVIDPQEDNEYGYTPYLRIVFNALDDDLSAAYNLISEILFRTDFSNTEALSGRVGKIRNSLKQSVNAEGYLFMLRRMFGHSNEGYAVYDYMSQLPYYSFLCEVEEAMAAMGEVTGATVREDITARIFERFCVGK